MTVTLPAWGGYGLIAIVVVLNSVGNILLKIGSGRPSDAWLMHWAAWPTLAGIACFASSVIAYIWALKHLPLHMAQATVATQYILTLALAATVLGERIAPQQWLGFGLIAAGLYLCLR
jgi:drug/metabolite transporter (DMT)-like permease